MADIFISFIHEEQQVAEALQRVIQESYTRQKIFISSDRWQLLAGEDWLQRIRQELASAKVVVLLLSEQSISRPWVNFEAGAAWLTEKKLIPACIGRLQAHHLPKPYSNLQAVTLPNDAYYLLNSLGAYLQLVSPTPGYEEHSSAFRNLQEAIARVFTAA